MTPLKNDGVLFEVSPLVIQDRPAVALLQASAARGGDAMRICGWCKRIPSSQGMWLEIEEAVQSFNLFERSAASRPDSRYMSGLQRLDDGGDG